MGEKDRGRNRRRQQRATGGLNPRPETAGSVESYSGVFKAQIRESERMASFFYLYTLDSVGLRRSDIPRAMSPDTIRLFYRGAAPAMDRLYASCETLLRTGDTLTREGGVTVDNMVRGSRVILAEGNSLVHDLKTFDETPVTNFKGYERLDRQHQAEFGTFRDLYGRSKPEVFREVMRRYLPRWMWIASFVQPPPGIDPAEVKRLKDLWTGAPIESTNLLVSKDYFSKGYLPLHRAFTVLDTLEQEGAEDLSYDSKTSMVLSLISIEARHLKKPANQEIPFFTYMFGGAMTGEVGSLPAKAYFDYPTAINKLMEQTYFRLQEEMKEGKSGLATSFLQSLSSSYADHFPELFARSLTHHARSSGDIDEVAILQGLQEREVPFVKGVAKEMRALRGNRILFLDELGRISRAVGEGQQREFFTPDHIIKQVQTLIGGDDIFSQDYSLVVGPHSNTNLELDIDASSESIGVVMHGNFGGLDKTVPFTLSLTGDRESFQIRLLDGETIPFEMIDPLRAVVLHLIDDAAKRKKQAQERSGQLSQDPPAQFSIAAMTRDQRLAQYAKDKRESSKGAESPPKAAAAAEVVYTASAETEEQDIEEAAAAIEIEGLNITTVAKMLEEQHIREISSQRLIDKVGQNVKATIVRGGELGKHINLTDRFGSKAEGINLRQVNWKIMGGRREIRIYFLHEDSTYKLVGIMSKSGGITQQQQYLGLLVDRINKGLV